MFSDPERRRCNDLPYFTVGGNITPHGKFESGYSS